MANDFGRNVVQPIRSKKDLEDCFTFLKREIDKFDFETHMKQKEIKVRNYFLVYLGINIGLRISDLRLIKVGSIKKGFIQLREQKTSKIQQIHVNQDVIDKLKKEYINVYNLDDEAYLFKSRKGYNNPISRQGAASILNKISMELNWTFPFNTHSLRKTFGFHYYKETNNIVGLQKMFNHKDTQTTLIYIGMIQAQVDEERKKFKVKF